MSDNDDFDRLLDSIYALHDRVAFRDFPRHVIDVTSRLFSADVCSYGEVDTIQSCAGTVSNHPESVERPLVDVWVQQTLAPEMVFYWRQFSAHQVLQFSDRMSDSEIERLPIYQEYFKQFGVFHQIILPFMCESGLVISLGFSRARHKGPFGRRERSMLERIGPHVARAYENAHALEIARRGQTRVDQHLELTEVGLIAISDDGGVEATTTNARRWVREFFHSFPTYTRQLPPHLYNWVNTQFRNDRTGQPREEDTHHNANATLTIRLLGTREGQDLLLVLTRHCPIATSVLSEALSLTSAQAEVFRLLTCGLSDAQITDQLNGMRRRKPISKRTVETHVAHLRERLGATQNRRDAITLGLQRLNAWFEARRHPEFL